MMMSLLVDIIAVQRSCTLSPVLRAMGVLFPNTMCVLFPSGPLFAGRESLLESSWFLASSRNLAALATCMDLCIEMLSTDYLFDTSYICLSCMYFVQCVSDSIENYILL